MNRTVAAAMFGWIPVALALFAWLPRRRAALAGFLIAWMFLPIAAYPIAGLPDYTKISATCGVVLLAIALFDFRRLIALRPRWVDAPILLFCLSPFASAWQNGLGMHEGVSVVFAQVITWGVPYAVGRLYFDDLAGLRELAIGIFGGGLLYVPLCLFELWKGPELHRLVYGYYQPDLDAEPRFGIFRPMVFLESGLMLAVWMAAATVLGIWLWRGRALPARGGVWLACLLPLLTITSVLLRSVNGWILLALGTGFLILLSLWRSAAAVVLTIAMIVVFIAIRAAGLWSGDQVAPLVSALISPAKQGSIAYRFWNENIVTANAREHALLGWGRQARAFDDRQGSFAVCDSSWIIVYAQFGAVGLAGFTASLLFPVVLFIRRFPARLWLEAGVAPAAALAVILVLYMIDHLANGMINPVFMLAAGGLTGLSAGAAAVRASAGA